MVVLQSETEAHDEKVLNIANFLDVQQPIMSEPVRLALKAGHAEASKLNPIGNTTYLDFLSTPVLTLGKQLGRNFYRPDLGEWLALFDPSGAPSVLMPALLLELRMTSLIVLGLPLAAAQGIPAVTPAPFFTSAEEFSFFNSKIALCHVRLPDGTVCPFTPSADGSNLCPEHVRTISSLAVFPAPLGASVILSPSDHFLTRKPTLAALSGARTVNIGESSFAQAYLIASTPLPPQKVRVSLAAGALEKSAVVPGHDALSFTTRFYPAVPRKSVESLVSYALGHPVFSLNPNTSHVSHALWGLRRVLGSSVFAICFSPQGTALSLLKLSGSCLTSTEPLAPFFLNYGLGAFPAVADLFGAASSELLQHAKYITHNPLLGIHCFALGCSVSDFLRMLEMYNDILHKNVQKNGIMIPSIQLSIFEQWMSDNSISGEFRDALIRAEMHLLFNVNQWLSSTFAIIHEQAKRLLGPLTAQVDAEVFCIQAALVQCFRNLGSNPGILNLVDIDQLEKKATQMANFSALDGLDPMFQVDPELKTATALLQARMDRATKHSESRVSVSRPIEEACNTARALSLSAPSVITKLRAPPVTKSPSPVRSPNGRTSTKRPLGSEEGQHSTAHEKADTHKSDQPNPHQAWFDTNISALLKSVPHSTQNAYKMSLLARLRRLKSTSMPCQNINDPSLSRGWKDGFRPIYRLLPDSRHTSMFCFACGVRSPGHGHTVYDCDRMSVAGTVFNDIPAMDAPAHQSKR
jgi:hypothetical protein